MRYQWAVNILSLSLLLSNTFPEPRKSLPDQLQPLAEDSVYGFGVLPQPPEKNTWTMSGSITTMDRVDGSGCSISKSDGDLTVESRKGTKGIHPNELWVYDCCGQLQRKGNVLRLTIHANDSFLFLIPLDEGQPIIRLASSIQMELKLSSLTSRLPQYLVAEYNETASSIVASVKSRKKHSTVRKRYRRKQVAVFQSIRITEKGRRACYYAPGDYVLYSGNRLEVEQ